MRKIFTCIIFCLLTHAFYSNAWAQNNVGINSTGANPDPSAALDVDANDKGMLIPRLTSVQRLAIVNPANGLLVYDVDQKCIYFYDATIVFWTSLCTGVGIVGTTGPTGMQGFQGIQGVTGPQGITGAVGPTGAQGNDGATGPTGPAGAQGIQGITGIIGPTGLQGIQGTTGLQGPTGPQGLIGVTGPQGIQGPTGAQGIQGITGLQGISGSIGPTGSQGIQGTTGIQGPTGPIGPTGAQGMDGITGPQGPTGAQGNDGVTGPQGITGPQGPTGAQGVDGITGPPGPTGPQGNDGVTGPQGITGPQGPTGAQGMDGITGPQGPTGAQGMDGITGPQGPTGAQGNDGVTGPQGITGPQGPTGAQGVDGITGPQGPTGPQGNDGVTGPQGITGPQGPAGAQGNDGVTGSQGITGPIGPTGAQGLDGVTGPQGPTGAQGIDGITGTQGPTGAVGPIGQTGPTGPQGIQGITGDLGPTGPTGPTGDHYWTELTGTYNPSTIPCGANGTACNTPSYIQVGTGAVSQASPNSPYRGFWSDGRMQYLYLASELTAAGMLSGSFNSIAFNVLIKNSTIPFTGFTIKIGCTSVGSLTGYIAGLTTVYSGDYSTSTGWNTHNFSVSYDWDGYSNIVVETCFDNAGFSNDDFVQMLATGANLSYYGYQDAYAAGTCTAILSYTGTNPNRPNIKLGYCQSSNAGPPVTGNYLTYPGGLVIGTPFGGYRGPGSINAQAVYDDGLLLTDYVFDSYFDGKISQGDSAKHFGFKIAKLDEMINYVEENRHLPSIKGRDDWNKQGNFSLGELTQQLWETVEIQSLYIKELHERLTKLENEFGQYKSDNDKSINTPASARSLLPENNNTNFSHDPYKDLMESINIVKNSYKMNESQKQEMITKLKLEYEKNQQ